jgi:hypothetical protein
MNLKHIKKFENIFNDDDSLERESDIENDIKHEIEFNTEFSNYLDKDAIHISRLSSNYFNIKYYKHKMFDNPTFDEVTVLIDIIYNSSNKRVQYYVKDKTNDVILDKETIYIANDEYDILSLIKDLIVKAVEPYLMTINY